MHRFYSGQIDPVVSHHLVLYNIISAFKCGLCQIIIVGNYSYYDVYGRQFLSRANIMAPSTVPAALVDFRVAMRLICTKYLQM